MPDSAFKLAARNFLKLDLLAPTINLKLRGESEVKTYTGAAFSFVAVSIFTALSIYTLKESLRTDNPNVLVEHMNSRQYPQIDLRKTKQMPMLIVISSGKPVPVWDLPSFIHIRMAVRINVVRDNQRFYTEDTPIPLVPCAELGWDAIQEFSTPDSEPLEKLVLMGSGICPNITGINLVVQGKLTSLLRHTLEITVYPCVPELLLPNQTCMTLQNQNARIHLLRAAANLDLKNYDTPVTFSTNVEEFYALSLNSEHNVNLNMKIVEVRNNEWGLYAESLVHTYSQIDQTKSDYYPRNPSQTSCSLQQITLTLPSCRPLVTLTIGSGGRKEVYTRAYRTVLQLVGVIGGIRALIFTLFFYFYGLFSSCTVKQKLEHILETKISLFFGQRTSASSKHQLANPDQEKQIITNQRAAQGSNTSAKLLNKMLDIERLVSRFCFLDNLAKYLGVQLYPSNSTDPEHEPIITYCTSKVHASSGPASNDVKSPKAGTKEIVIPQIEKSLDPKRTLTPGREGSDPVPESNIKHSEAPIMNLQTFQCLFRESFDSHSEMLRLRGWSSSGRDKPAILRVAGAEDPMESSDTPTLGLRSNFLNSQKSETAVANKSVIRRPSTIRRNPPPSGFFHRQKSGTPGLSIAIGNT